MSVNQTRTTPEWQLASLALSRLEKDVGIAHEPLPLSREFFSKCFESAIHSILKRSGILPLPDLEGEEAPSLFDLCVERLTLDSRLSDAETQWYNTLHRLNALPEEIPPLPENIHQILKSKCPIYGDPYKIKDTHLFALIPEEFETLHHFEREILNPYGVNLYRRDNHPLRFRNFDSQNYSAPFKPTYWALITKDVLPGSLNKSLDEQLALIESLSQNASAEYEIPSLQQMFVAIMIEKIAGKNLYQNTYTRLPQIICSYNVTIGKADPFGVKIQHIFSQSRHEDVGIAAVRKFY